MTEPGETDGMGGVQHLDAIERQAGQGLVDLVVTNVGTPSDERLNVYAEQGARPVIADPALLASRGVRVLERDLLSRSDLIRHDPAAIRAVVEDLLEEGA